MTDIQIACMHADQQEKGLQADDKGEETIKALLEARAKIKNFMTTLL